MLNLNINCFAEASFGRHTDTHKNQVLVCHQGSCRNVPVSRFSTINLQSPNLQIYVRDRSGRLKHLPQFTVRSQHSGRVVERCRFSNLRNRYFCRIFSRRGKKNCYSTRVVRVSCYHRFKCKKYTVVKRRCPVKGRVRLKCPNKRTLARLDYYRTKCMRLVYRCSYSESTKCKKIRHKCQKIANFLKHCPTHKRSNQRRHRKYKPCASNYHRCRSRGYGLKTCLDRYSRCSKLLKCSKLYSRCARKKARLNCRVRHRRCRKQVHLSVDKHLALTRRKRRKLCRKLYGRCRQYSNQETCRHHFSQCLLSAQNQTGFGSRSRLERNFSVQKCKRLQKYTVKCRFVMMICNKDRTCKKSLMFLCQRVLKTLRLCREIQKERKCLHFRSYQSRCSRVLQICERPGSFCSIRYVRVCQKLIRVVHQCQKNLSVADLLDGQTYHRNHHRHPFYRSHHHHHHHHHHRHHSHHYHQRYHRHYHDQHGHHQYRFVTQPRLFSVCKRIIVYRDKCANLIKFCESNLYPNPRVCRAKHMSVCKKALKLVKSCTVLSTRQYKYHQHAFKHQYGRIRRGRSCSENISKRSKCHRLIRHCSKRHPFYSRGRTYSKKCLKGCYKVLRLARMCHHDNFSFTTTHKHHHEILHDHRRVLYPKCKRQTNCSSAIRYTNQCKSRIRQCRNAGVTNIKKCLGVYGGICEKLIRYQRHCCSQYHSRRTQSSQFHRDPPIERQVHRSTRTLSEDTPENKDKVKIESSEKLIHDRDGLKKYHYNYQTKAQLKPRIKVKHGKWLKSKSTQRVHSVPKSELEVEINTNQLPRAKSSHQKYFREYQTCSKNIRVYCKDNKCKNRKTVLLLQSVCYFKFYSKMMCSRIRRASEKCGFSSSPTCKRIRSAKSRHCRGSSKESGQSPCRTAKQTLTSCYQLYITKCNFKFKNKYRCHMSAARICKMSLEYQHDLSRCKKWSRKTRRKRCHALKKSLKFCHRFRCRNLSKNTSFCQLKILKCKYFVQLHEVSCQKQALKKSKVLKQGGSSFSSKKQSVKKSNLSLKKKQKSLNSSGKLAKNNINYNSTGIRLAGREQYEKNTDMKNKAKKLQGSISKINVKKTVSIATHRNKLLAVQKTGLGHATENGPNKGIVPKLGTGKGQHAEKPTRNRQRVNVSKKEIEKESSKGKEQVMVQHRATKQQRENRSNKESKSDKGQKLKVQNPKEPTPSLELETASKEHDHDYTGDVSKKIEKSKKEETTNSVRKTKQLQQTKNGTSTRPTSKDGSGVGESEKDKHVKPDQPTPKKVGDEDDDEISEEDGQIANKKIQASPAKQQVELESKSEANERLMPDNLNDRSIKRANRNDDENPKERRDVEIERKPHDQKARADGQTNHELYDSLSNRTHEGTDKPSPTNPEYETQKERLNHKKAKSKKTPLVAEKPYEWGPGRPIQYPKSMTVDDEESNHDHAQKIKTKKSDSDSPEGPLTSEAQSSSVSIPKNRRNRVRVLVHSADGSLTTVHNKSESSSNSARNHRQESDIKRNVDEDCQDRDDVDNTSKSKKSLDIPTSDEEVEVESDGEKGNLKHEPKKRHTTPFTASGFVIDHDGIDDINGCHPSKMKSFSSNCNR